MKTGLISFGERYAVNSKAIMCQGDVNLHRFFFFMIVCLRVFVCIGGFNVM